MSTNTMVLLQQFMQSLTLPTHKQAIKDFNNEKMGNPLLQAEKLGKEFPKLTSSELNKEYFLSLWNSSLREGSLYYRELLFSIFKNNNSDPHIEKILKNKESFLNTKTIKNYLDNLLRSEIDQNKIIRSTILFV